MANFVNGLESIGVRLPILTDPTNLFNIILGYPVQVFSYDLPQVTLDYNYDQYFPVWPVPPISVHLGADLQFQAGASVGYNTGLIDNYPNYNFADGFYVQDGLVDGNGNPASVHVGLHVSVGPALGIPDLATLNVDGQLNGDIWLRLANTDASDRVRGSALFTENNVFNTSGTITAGLNIYLSLGSQEVADWFSWFPPAQSVVYQNHTIFQSRTVQLANFDTDSDDRGYGRVSGAQPAAVVVRSELLADAGTTGPDRSDEVGTVSDPKPSIEAPVEVDLMISADHFNYLVTQDYANYLNRAPSATELNYFVPLLLSGAINNDNVVIALLASAEFYKDAGSTSKGWVDGLYEGLLSRNATAADEAYWAPYLAAGGSRVGIAASIAQSKEHRQDLVVVDYLKVLG
ncbi:MAG: DUF4214 domain-containing protein, partial [Planctomycetia bacterium]|nr:DUF4214 domain-containing protein [Planctomycetia bacterium]